MIARKLSPNPAIQRNAWGTAMLPRIGTFASIQGFVASITPFKSASPAHVNAKTMSVGLIPLKIRVICLPLPLSRP